MPKARAHNNQNAADTHDHHELLTPESLVRRYASAVLGLCLAHTKNVHDGEDIMQEVFLKAFSKFHTLREPGNARAWLLQIARRSCIDHYRRRTPDRQIPEGTPAPPQQTGDDRVKHLHRAISELPETFREPITLYYINGRNCSSVAKTLGVSESAVRSRLSRARLKLHEILAEDSK